ncbi:hypothetical protein [Azonexus hydrophilus]|uniref:Uncharacterized protein n=1 Tax=Azonexus hydrophilus TaxID=418702 RepID=A0ABZ2XKU2_9RHOO
MPNNSIQEKTNQMHGIISTLNQALLSPDAEEAVYFTMQQASINNPGINIRDCISQVLSHKTTMVDGRPYELRLMAIPVVGSFQLEKGAIKNCRQILLNAKQMGLTGKMDGVVILDAPLSRRYLQQIGLGDINELAVRLFERGALSKEQKVIPDKIQGESDLHGSVVIALAYWKKGAATPKLVTNAEYRRDFAKLVENQLRFEAAKPGFIPQIHAHPMQNLLDATALCLRATLASLLPRVIQEGNNVRIQVADMGGEHHLLISDANGPMENGLAISVDEIRDGNLSEIIEYIKSECCAKIGAAGTDLNYGHGKFVESGISYQKTALH